MRKQGIAVLGALSIAVGLTGPLVKAGTVSLDLSDFNDDVMRDMDDTMKRLDSDIATRDAKAVASDSASIREGLGYAQEYFRKKGNFEDAVRWAKQGRDLVEAVTNTTQAGDFDTSLSKYDSLVKTCRACHDVYKPPDI
jgi:cytochrome c556